MLASHTLGPNTLKPGLVLAHGFTQNSRCWGNFGDLSSENFDVRTIDAPGHGQSGYDNADLYQAGKLLVEAGGAGHYLGYSMGGRMLLHAALQENLARLMRSLILIGATPGIDNPAERQERQIEDARRAARIESIGTVAFIDEWLAQPMFAGLTSEQSGHSKRYENSADGMAASLRNCGTGAQHPIWDQLHRLRMPVLVIAGSNDHKFTDIGTRMVATIGSNARFVTVEGGHAVHLENPVVTAAVVASWGEQLS